MRRSIGWIVMSVFVSACVSVPPPTKPGSDARTGWHGKTLAVTARPVPTFVASTADKAAFGLIGVGAMAAAGNKIVRDNRIEDPAGQLARDLAAMAVEAYGLVLKPGPAIAVKTDDIGKLALAANGSDFLLDVQLTGWSFIYQPLDWTHYTIASSFVVRLIDVRLSRVAGSGSCGWSNAKEAHLPTYKELLDEHAAMLKALLAEQREHCLAQFKQNVLNVTDTSMPAEGPAGAVAAGPVG